jgi:TRAP-type C4-dicarboxylate transport system permease large subunit
VAAARLRSGWAAPQWLGHLRGGVGGRDGSRRTTLIFAIVASVLICVHFLGFTGTLAAIADNIVHWNLSPTLVLIGILVPYLFLGSSSTASAWCC